jgi:uncharacterized protein
VAVYFLDSSAVVKRYLTEIGSPWMKGITDPAAGNNSWVCALAGVEVLAALYRRVRTGVLLLPQARRLDHVFRADLNTLFGVIEPEPGILGVAMRLVAIHPLRAYDAVQLATALYLRSQYAASSARLRPTFISADQNLARAAALEGLPTDDPNLHP